jgi:hypothetical protein
VPAGNLITSFKNATLGCANDAKTGGFRSLVFVAIDVAFILAAIILHKALAVFLRIFVPTL